MSYMVLFSFKLLPPSSCLPSVIPHTETSIILQEVEDNSGIYLFGDGHSSQNLICRSDIKQHTVILRALVIDFFKCSYVKNCYPSLLVSYASKGIMDSYRPVGRIKVNINDLDDKFSFQEQYKYSIYKI